VEMEALHKKANLLIEFLAGSSPDFIGRKPFAPGGYEACALSI